MSIKSIYTRPLAEEIILIPEGLIAQSTQNEDLNEVQGSWDDSSF